MARTWSFGRRLGGGFAIMVALAGILGGVGIYSLRSAVDSYDRVVTVNARLLTDAEKLRYALEHKVSSSRGYLFRGEEEHLRTMTEARDEFLKTLADLKGLALTADGRALLDRIEALEEEHQAALAQVIEMRRADAALDFVQSAFTREVKPRRDRLNALLDEFRDRESRLLEDARGEAQATAFREVVELSVLMVLVLAAALVLGLVFTRLLSREIGSAVLHVQGAATELQATANQQASGAKEQATAMTEISSTIRELLATSRQIAESAQHVARIAEETAASARSGDTNLQRSQESMAAVGRQVEQIVTHMVDLGRKSQQIGGILELINEHAEQTNILAINASIEAAGAGDAGLRFAVVAEEIRRLADRVGGSSREIRGLVDEIRGAVNTTILATETGAKSVDAGARQFAELASVFGRIVGQVSTTTDAAREIELSTKQQTTAVEQVNVAVGDVARASSEVESGARQVLQTSSVLATLSRDLTRITRGSAGDATDV